MNAEIKDENDQAEAQAAAAQVFRCRVCKLTATRHEWPLRMGLMHCGSCVREHGDMTLDFLPKGA